ncbi:MAG: hypothetical protein A2660_01055 [Candidatus Doudnabacteria bacterium RIFCSPHIGHO2_01_FULL_45_18]|uniref:DUF456 domain-containing protein n=1 Tax=Candidatus Doudnabacteria bacterium RIFCSPHIGHO2_01_FULL_45_18 TaxID=1817823 RepID=A0A1F5NRM4_9BACT|nr:MAG: hypothetical protein A2660_01055 [Candidatus Doudnabacteria bacterium RIFCSPHIGHO2_01_FULL_45_18]
MNQLAIGIISGFLIFLGTLGAILPFLPGLPLALAGLILFAWTSHAISIWGIAIFVGLVLVTILVDIFAPALAAKGRKVSKYGVWGALIGGFLGIALLGPIGILLGPLAGAFFGEMMNAGTTEDALQAAGAAMIGLVIGSVFKLMVGLAMFVYFLVNAINI